MLYPFLYSIQNDRSAGRPREAHSLPNAHQLLPSHGGPEVLLEGWVGPVALPDFRLLIQPRLT